MLKQLGEQDASYLYLETPETPQHVGGVTFLELPAGYAGDFYEDYKKHIASRIHLVPLLHMKLVPLPFDLDHPFWAEDENLEVDYHIRRLTLAKPGRIAQLEELVGRLHSNFLDRSRPLWEFYVIDGLEDGRIAIYTKIHHAAMDGASSLALITTLYDPTPAGRSMPPPPGETPGAPKPTIEEVLRGVVAHFVRQEIRAIQFVPEALKAWATLALPDVETLKYERAPKPAPAPPKTLFNVGITSQRAYALRTLSLGRVKRVARQAQCKLNDVVLAICAGALRHYLAARDKLPKKPMTAMVPVAAKTGDGAPEANHNHMYFCSLATDIEEPYARLMAIRESSSEQKRLLGTIRNALLPDLAVIGSGALRRGMVDLYARAKLADRLPPLYNVVVSNVAGPPVPLYIAGAKVLSFHPCSIPFHGTALNITVESYCDSLDFGLIACRRAVPDVAEIADHLEPALAELEAAVGREVAALAALPPAAAATKTAVPPRLTSAPLAPAVPARKPANRQKALTPAAAAKAPKPEKTTRSAKPGASAVRTAAKPKSTTAARKPRAPARST